MKRDRKNRLTFLNVGRFDPVKGHCDLVDAFSEVCRRLEEVELILVGDGPLLSEVRKLAGKLGIGQRVVFIGNSDRVNEILEEADVFVLTSYEEGCPNALLEAMAAGLPVIGYDIPAVRELVTARNAAILVPVGQVECLAAEMLRLAIDPGKRTELGLTARAVAEEEFGVERMCMEYYRLFKKELRSVGSEWRG